MVWERFISASTDRRAEVLSEIGSNELEASLLAMGVATRREAFSRLSAADKAMLLAKISQSALVAFARQGIAALGTYRARLVKEERVRNKVGEAQTLEIVVRNDPLAFRLDFKAGPSAGRRALYNSEIRRNEVRLREGGALGLVGAMWLDLDNPLTRVDTNHRATEIGFSPLLDLIEGDLREAALKGVTHTRVDEGLDRDGHYRAVFTAPPGVLSLYAVSTRIGFDPLASLPTLVEVHDQDGHLETYRYSNVEKVDVKPDFFTLKGASL